MFQATTHIFMHMSIESESVKHGEGTWVIKPQGSDDLRVGGRRRGEEMGSQRERKWASAVSVTWFS